MKKSIQIINKIKNNPIFYILSIILIIILYFYINWKPWRYCEEEQRVLSDEEMCEKILKRGFESGIINRSKNDLTLKDYVKNHDCNVSNIPIQYTGLRESPREFGSLFAFDLTILRNNNKKEFLSPVSSCGNIPDPEGGY